MNAQFKVDIMGALARGYCSDLNQGKELDTNLIEAMFTEVMKVVGAKFKEAAKVIKLYSDCNSTIDSNEFGVVSERINGKWYEGGTTANEWLKNNWSEDETEQTKSD